MLNPVNHTAKPSTGYLLCGGGNEDHLPGIYNRQTSRFQQTFNEIKVSAKEQQSKCHSTSHLVFSTLVH